MADSKEHPVQALAEVTIGTGLVYLLATTFCPVIAIPLTVVMARELLKSKTKK